MFSKHAMGASRTLVQTTVQPPVQPFRASNYIRTADRRIPDRGRCHTEATARPLCRQLRPGGPDRDPADPEDSAALMMSVRNGQLPVRSQPSLVGNGSACITVSRDTARVSAT
jgi:hypothetical protein